MAVFVVFSLTRCLTIHKKTLLKKCVQERFDNYLDYSSVIFCKAEF